MPEKNPVAANLASAATDGLWLDPSVPANSYYIGGVQVHFPFKPYPSQLAMMNHMIRALNGSQNTMIESPTGSGKSLALLCASLAWRQSFMAKRRQLLANVNQIISRFCRDNHQLLVAKFAGDIDADDAELEHVSAPDKPSKSRDPELAEPAPPKDNDDDDDDFMPTAKSKVPEETKNKPNHDPAYLQQMALIRRAETVDYIIDLARTRMPDGVSLDDLSVLSGFKDQGEEASHAPRIYFGTRTHKQVSQLIDELRRKTPYRLRTAVLGSRAQTCIHGRAKKAAASGESVDDMCRTLREDDNCGPFRAYRKIIGHKKLARRGELEIWDLEDLVTLGRKNMACPYFASRDMAGTAELVFCPYNYILDPAVRKAAGINLDHNVVILDEAHNIENAARDAGSFEVTDSQLSVLAFECAKLIGDQHVHDGELLTTGGGVILLEEHRVLRTFAETLSNWLQRDSNTYEYRDFETETSVWPKPDCPVSLVLQRLALTPEVVARIKSAFSKIDEQNSSARSQASQNKSMGLPAEEQQQLSAGALRIVESLLRVLDHVANGSKYASDFRMAIIRSPNPELRDQAAAKKRKRYSVGPQQIPPFVNTLAFWCMNPGVVFNEIAQQSRSIVLTSGTLSPLDSYASELQVDFASTLEANHVIDPARFLALSIECGPSGSPLEAKYRTTDQLSFQDDMGEAIASIAARCPDGMLVFAPSYALLNKLLARWEVTGHLAEINVHKEVFIEPQGGGSKDQFDKLLAAYRDHLQRSSDTLQPLQRGALMFAVYRGKVSEGIDFSDYYCRTVVNIGIPYPAFKDVKVVLKREYNDAYSNPSVHERVLLNGSKWYDIQAFRAINQALGRCLRHKNDWGAIIMLEARFTHPRNINRLSKWVRSHMRVFHGFNAARQQLESFYNERIQDDAALGTLIDDAVITLEE
ncbi:hypothetical protein LPJ63_002316 [Coemansia sp. RSA 2711]|nr:hypothetical protein LPJ63_002316 [Coemansia sp. RSA 2711]